MKIEPIVVPTTFKIVATAKKRSTGHIGAAWSRAEISGANTKMPTRIGPIVIIRPWIERK